MIQWPDYMPDPEITSIQIGPPQGATIRTTMDAGPAYQRPRFTAAPRPVSLSFVPISKNNLLSFEAFFETQLSFGALSFEMVHPITGLARTFRFVVGDQAYEPVQVGRDAYRINTTMELLL